MNIPNIPSDNLYKFIALGSLITLILLTYFSQKTEIELTEAEINYSGEINIAIIKSEDLNNQLANQYELLSKLKTELIQQIEEMKAGKVQAEASNNENKILEDKISSLSDRIDSKKMELDLLLASNETTRLQLDNKRRLKNTINDISIYSSGILFIFMILGFYLWYVRVQKYQDRILKIQSKEVQQVSNS